MTPEQRVALDLLRAGQHDEFDQQVGFRVRTSLRRDGLADFDPDKGRFEATRAGRRAAKGGR